jgi:hypothetical protein
LLANDLRIEEDLSGIVPCLVIDLDDALPIRQFVGPLLLGKGVSRSQSMVVIKGYLAHLLLDLSHKLSVGGVNVRVLDHQRLKQSLSDVLAGKVDALNGVGESVSLEDWHCVGHSLSTLNNNTCSSASGEETEDS